MIVALIPTWLQGFEKEAGYMTKQEEIMKAEYDLQWLDAERDLAIMEYENAVWVDKRSSESNGN